MEPSRHVGGTAISESRKENMHSKRDVLPLADSIFTHEAPSQNDFVTSRDRSPTCPWVHLEKDLGQAETLDPLP